MSPSPGSTRLGSLRATTVVTDTPHVGAVHVDARRSTTPRWFWIGLALAAAAGLVVRVLYVDHVAIHQGVPWDGVYNHQVANGFAAGQGWIDQNLYHTTLGRIVRPTAYFPPLFGLLLVGPSWLGANTLHDHQLVSAGIGTLSVLVAGLLGRSVRSPAVGVIAAAIAALHPLVFGTVGTLMTETLYIPLAGAAVLATYAARRRPTIVAFVVLGAVLALAALTRGDGLGLIVVLGVPLVVSLRGLGRARWKLAAVGLGTIVVVLAPWSIRNALTFHEPVLISNNEGTLLAGSNCHATFSGARIGSWDPHCPDVDDHSGNEATLNGKRRNLGLGYALDHLGQLPYVAAVRVARTWVPPSSNDQTRVEDLEGRNAHWQWLGELVYVAGLPFAIAGIVVLRRRKAPVWPLLATVVLVCLVSASGYGTQRFRAAAELPIIVLTATGLAAAATAGRAKLAESRRVIDLR